MVVTKITVVKGPVGVEKTPAWQEYVNIGAKTTGHSVYWGRQAEEPDKIWILSDRDNFEDHANGTGLLAIDETLGTETGLEPVAVYNVRLPRSDRTSWQAPTTEISIGFFQRDNGASSGFERVVRDFSEKAEASGLPGCGCGANSAWTVEEDAVFTNLAGSSARGRGLFSTVGWASQEAHYAFNQTDFVKQNAGAIAAAGVEGWKIAHVDFHKVDP